MAERSAAQLVLVVGSRNSGKTGYARSVVERARAAGLRVAGFLSEAEWDGAVKARFYLQDVADPACRVLLASVEPAPGLDVEAGPFHLSSSAFRMAEAEFRNALDADLICMDEVGPLELRGEGFHNALRHLVARYRGTLLLTVRPSAVEAIMAMEVRD